MDSLSADLYVRVSCTTRYQQEMENPTLQFMRQQGFQALNVGRMQREHWNDQRAPGLVAAVDADGQLILNMRQSPFVEVKLDDAGTPLIRTEPTPAAKSSFSIALYSRPPTHRRIELESKIEAFAATLAQKPGCAITSVQRHENSSKAHAMFERKLETTRGWFEQADEMIRRGET